MAETWLGTHCRLVFLPSILLPFPTWRFPSVIEYFFISLLHQEISGVPGAWGGSMGKMPVKSKELHSQPQNWVKERYFLELQCSYWETGVRHRGLLRS